MTVKRFEILDSASNWVGFNIRDNLTGRKYYGGRLIQCTELCDFLNEMYEKSLGSEDESMKLKYEKDIYQHFINDVLKILAKYEIDSLEKLDRILMEQRVW